MTSSRHADEAAAESLNLITLTCTGRSSSTAWVAAGAISPYRGCFVVFQAGLLCRTPALTTPSIVARLGQKLEKS